MIYKYHRLGICAQIFDDGVNNEDSLEDTSLIIFLSKNASGFKVCSTRQLPLFPNLLSALLTYDLKGRKSES